MLKITQEQIELLSQRKWQEDVKKRLPELRKKFPRVFRYYSDEQLLRWVERNTRYLGHCGIDSQPAEDTIIYLFALFGENFERSEQCDEAMDTLMSKYLDADQKAALLLKVFKL